MKSFACAANTSLPVVCRRSRFSFLPHSYPGFPSFPTFPPLFAVRCRFRRLTFRLRVKLLPHRRRVYICRPCLANSPVYVRVSESWIASVCVGTFHATIEQVFNKPGSLPGKALFLGFGPHAVHCGNGAKRAD